MDMAIYLLLGMVLGGLLGWLLGSYRMKAMHGLSRQEADTLLGERSRLEERNALLEEKLGAQREELQALQERMRDEFQSIANRILLESTRQIQDQHKVRLEDVLEPLKEKIDRFERKVDDTHKETIRENQSLKEQILNLQKLNQTIGEEARNLTTALKGQSKTQGNWGEVLLESILERSGLQKGSEYRVQESTVNTDGRRLQPDVLICLPQGKHIVVDAKMSLIAYERYCSAEEAEARGAALDDHVVSVRRHIRELSEKNYQLLYGVSSPDFVLMFIPIEPAFNEAMRCDPTLYTEAFERNVVLVSTSTLLATLRTIAGLWRQENQNRNALEIARQGGELYDKFVGFAADLLELGRRLQSAQQAYDDTLLKLQSGRGNLVRRAEELRRLGAKTSKTMPLPLVQTPESLPRPAAES